ncbi:hypothetical protein [Glycomyces rhizosphaerae]|uniref:SMI1/KNR4 family protein n=1 Tax=Glycomyces rhizosphaerae TaxID=2054422 RepID=A0ABV7PUN2_9ACTN
MLDDMRELRDSLERYRAAAQAAGIELPAPERKTPAPPTDLVLRMTDVEQIPEQLLWLYSIGWGAARLFPEGVFLMDWPGEAEIAEYVDYTALAIGVPFPWRQQLPIFFTDHVVLTFVLAEGHVGEIWHYEWEPDSTSPVRAAMSLAGLFDQWTKGIEIGVVVKTKWVEWLQVIVEGDEAMNDEATLERLAVLGLDPLAFPLWMGGCSRLREWQAACGVDPAEIDREFDAREEMVDAAIAVAAELQR